MGRKIKVAIAGVGNCASALIQGIEYYKSLGKDHPDKSLGLMHYDLGGYMPEDIEIVAAFDIDERKAGKPLKEAIFARPNCTRVFYSALPEYNVTVMMGVVLDSISLHMMDYRNDKRLILSSKRPCNVARVLEESGAEMLLNYLPVGSEKATAFYADTCLKTGVSFINCIPVFVASDKIWAKRFEKKRIPIIGDDIKSQVGATIIHRVLTRLFEDRGVRIDRTYQLNVGGNTDFLNMLDRQRVTSKKISKIEAVQSQMSNPLPEDKIHIGPSDYVPWLNDNKVCFLRIEGRGFGNVPLHLELRLSVEDSPNSAGVAIDAIRCCRIAHDRGIGGALTSASAYFMKHPMIQMSDEEAHKRVEEFISGKIER